MAESSGFPESLTRRGVVAAAGGVGLAAVLTACGSDSSSDDASSGSSPSKAPTTAAAPATSAPAAGTPSSGGGAALGSTADIPVGGGKVFAAQKVVVTQPSAGQFKGFSAVCTHQGCTVAKVSDGLIHCPCHGSAFHVADGSVASGPATSALPAKTVTVSGDEVALG